jgi:hypothetical protein
VDDVNPNDRKPTKRSTRVLRAMDVMPPFDKDMLPADEGAVGARRVPKRDESRLGSPPRACPPDGKGQLSGQGGRPRGAAPTGGEHESGIEGRFPAGAAAKPLPAEDVEVPAYDLAENILAEQRRVAGRRRRGPGRAENMPAATPRGAGGRLATLDLPTQDLLELQRIVAEIVARDIERLCRRPKRPVPVHS